MTTTVIHMRKAPPDWRGDPRFVYVGRRGHGFDGYFGNPLRTLTGYPGWLMSRLDTDPGFRAAVATLKGKTLVCFCKPRACHGDYLALFAETT